MMLGKNEFLKIPLLLSSKILSFRPPPKHSVGVFQGNLPHVANIDNRPASVLSRKSPLLCNSRQIRGTPVSYM
jgi:hypothetical protein